MATYYIRRNQVKTTLDVVCASPWRVLRALVVRRSPVYLRYLPRSMTENGAVVRDGDCCRLDVEDRGNASIIYGPDGKRYDLRLPSSNRRPGEKIIVQPAGAKRWISVKNYDRELGNQSKHAPERVSDAHYNPLDLDLYPLAGFYNDQPKMQPSGGIMIGRFGQWRPYTQLCMRGVIEFRAIGHRWIVTDPPVTEPIHNRQHVGV